MIVFLRGEIVHKDLEALHLEVGGVGYGLAMSSRSLSSIGIVGDEVFVYTYLQPRDTEINLYGFSTIQERDLFMLLIGVSGIGPKVALSVLSTLNVPTLINAIVTGDEKLIATAPGLGKKTAQRLILELKDTFKSSSTPELGGAAMGDVELGESSLDEARAALVSMGFVHKEIDTVMTKLVKPESMSTEELVLAALQRLST